jgi:hypothetical protein
VPRIVAIYQGDVKLEPDLLLELLWLPVCSADPIPVSRKVPDDSATPSPLMRPPGLRPVILFDFGYSSKHPVHFSNDVE